MQTHGKSIVFALTLDDKRFTFKEKAALFDAMRLVVPGDVDMMTHLTHLSAYYTQPKSRRQWRGDSKMVIANNVILVWDDCPKRMEPFDMLRDNGVLASLSCFMFYNEDSHAVHILNWRCRLSDTVTSPDYYMPHLIESVAFIKRTYLAADKSSVTHLMVEIAPIAETLCAFGILMDFVLVVPEPRRPMAPSLTFQEACHTKDFDAFHTLAADPRNRTHNTEGVEVLRLYYVAKVCECAIRETAQFNLNTISVFQCKRCHDVRFCTKKCELWHKCC